MIPGMGGADPRQLGAMMKRLGIDVRDIPDVEEVVIRTPERDYVFAKATVSVMRAQGVETWQLSGQPTVRERAPKPPFTDDDVKMVAERTGRGEVEARKALEATGGDLAEAIVQLAGKA
ncbi:MAG TPA: nascent polypeptide-associated complex protein [Candidatus Thermoplasmatota archaeon]|nr:nascent polypeptide-associated complex protein [Candidatus Thermoplasmatota archaeon]